MIANEVSSNLIVSITFKTHLFIGDIELSIEEVSKLVPEWIQILTSSKGRLVKIVGSMLSSQDVHSKIISRLQ
jgi:hypothetical protein